MSSSPSTPFLDAVKARRTFYGISSKSPIPDSKIVEIVQTAIKHVPSSFNSQSSRAIVVFGEEHDYVWETVKEVLKSVSPPEAYPAAVQKIDGAFKAGHGTVLFFEDQASVKGMQDRFPLYQDRFPVWSGHTSGMAQFVTWTALEKEGLGASLQHYNPLIDEKIRAKYDLPVTWALVSQMPFGTPVAQPGEKTFSDINERVRVFGTQNSDSTAN